jgi:2-phosphoglycerate kinase
MRSNTNAKDFPVLHTSAILACDWAPAGQDKQIWGFTEQSSNIKSGILAVCKRSDKENFDLILEGIHPQAEFFENINKPNGPMHFTIVSSNAKSYNDRLSGQGNDRSNYKLDNFEKALAYQNYLIEKAKEYGSVIIDNEDVKTSVEEIMNVLKQST